MNIVKIPNTELDACGAVLPESVGLNEYREIVKQVGWCEGSVKFWICDIYMFGRKKFKPEEVQRVFEDLGIDEGIARTYATVHEIPHSHRSKNLSFGHHKAIADNAPKEKQLEFIKLAEENKWSVPELRRQIYGIRPMISGDDSKPMTEFAPGHWASEVVRMAHKWKWHEWPEDRREALRKELKPAKELLDQLWSS